MMWITNLRSTINVQHHTRAECRYLLVEVSSGSKIFCIQRCWGDNTLLIPQWGNLQCYSSNVVARNISLKKWDMINKHNYNVQSIAHGKFWYCTIYYTLILHVSEFVSFGVCGLLGAVLVVNLTVQRQGCIQKIIRDGLCLLSRL